MINGVVQSFFLVFVEVGGSGRNNKWFLNITSVYSPEKIKKKMDTSSLKL